MTSMIGEANNLMPVCTVQEDYNERRQQGRQQTFGSVASSGGRCSREAKWKLLMVAARARLTAGSASCSALRHLHAT